MRSKEKQIEHEPTRLNNLIGTPLPSVADGNMGADNRSVIEQLAEKYTKLTEASGKPAEHSFWSWLNALGISPNDEELQALMDDDSMWI